MKKNCFVAVTIVSFLLSLQMVMAHEFIVQPEVLSSGGDNTVRIRVISAHVFMESEEVEPIDQVEVYKLTTKRQDVSMKVNEQDKILEGEVAGEKGVDYFICGHRKPIIWTKTTEGWKQEGKKNLSGVISSGMYEKFSKAYVGGTEDGQKYKEAVGQRLEIIPMGDPTKIGPGEELQVKVLFDSKPIATELYATFDGFSSSPGTYAYFSSTDDNGLGSIKITNNGRWMVRVEQKLNDQNEDYDTHVLRAVFLFEAGNTNKG